MIFKKKCISKFKAENFEYYPEAFDESTYTKYTVQLVKFIRDIKN